MIQGRKGGKEEGIQGRKGRKEGEGSQADEQVNSTKLG